MVKFSRQLAPEVQSYVLNSVVGCFDDTNDSIRSTVGTVVASILQVRTLDEWPGLSDKFFEALQSDNQFLLDGVLSCLFKICEDYAARYAAQQNIPQSLTKFIINLVPNLERFLTVPQEPFRYYSLSSLSLLLQFFPSSINYIFDTFVEVCLLALPFPFIIIIIFVFCPWLLTRKKKKTESGKVDGGQHPTHSIQGVRSPQ